MKPPCLSRIGAHVKKPLQSGSSYLGAEYNSLEGPVSRPQIIDSGAKDRRPPVNALVVGKPYDVGPACPKVGAVWGKDSGAGHHARPLQRIYMEEGTIDLPGRSAIGVRGPR